MKNNLQLKMFDVSSPPDQVINTSKVTHRSPLRYPGGKTWLVPRIAQWLQSLSKKPKVLVEPFCGGAIIGLTVAFERLADHVILVELDEQVAALWRTILVDEEGGKWLADRVLGFSLTFENVEAELAAPADSPRTLAWQSLLRNRINRGGILAKGAGKLKKGESGRGIASRWYPQTLAQRILDIVGIRDRITFITGDGLQVMKKNGGRASTVFFIDPPYTMQGEGKRAGSRLYDHADLDHQRLFDLASGVKGDFLMTYDNAPAVQALADQHGFDTQSIAMKNTHHAEMSELLIGRDLAWVRGARK